MTPYIEDILELAEVKLANHGTRLMKLEDRIGFAEAWHDDHEKRLEIINKQITELSQAVLKAQCNGHEYLADEIKTARREIAALANAMNDTTDRLDTISRFHPHTSKPTFKIKGGWLNLYYTSPGKTARAGTLFATRGEADAAADGSDHRIACIHITDFSEGEGL